MEQCDLAECMEILSQMKVIEKETRAERVQG